MMVDKVARLAIVAYLKPRKPRVYNLKTAWLVHK